MGMHWVESKGDLCPIEFIVSWQWKKTTDIKQMIAQANH
jgi:hypothetical protein